MQFYMGWLQRGLDQNRMPWSAMEWVDTVEVLRMQGQWHSGWSDGMTSFTRAGATKNGQHIARLMRGSPNMQRLGWDTIEVPVHIMDSLVTVAYIITFSMKWQHSSGGPRQPRRHEYSQWWPWWDADRWDPEVDNVRLGAGLGGSTSPS